MLNFAEIWKRLHLNRHERRMVAKIGFDPQPYVHLSRKDMGITTRPQFQSKKQPK